MNARLENASRCWRRLAAHLDREAGRHLDGSETLFDVVRDGPEIPPGGVPGHPDQPLLVLPLDLDRGHAPPDLREGGQHDRTTGGRGDEDLPEVLRPDAEGLVELDDDVVLISAPRGSVKIEGLTLTLELREKSAAWAHVALAQTRGRRLLAVDDDVELRIVAFAAHLDVGHARRRRA